MSFDEDNHSHHQNGEQALLERPQSPAANTSSAKETDWQRSGTNDDAVRARAPTPREAPSAEPRVVDSPPLHSDGLPEPDGARANKHRGFMRRHRFGSVVGLLLLIPTVGAGYLYWDNSQHFESTDDSFISARQFAVAPQVSGTITSVPVTDNQHVAAGGMIARIDDRSRRMDPYMDMLNLESRWSLKTRCKVKIRLAGADIGDLDLTVQTRGSFDDFFQSQSRFPALRTRKAQPATRSAFRE